MWPHLLAAVGAVKEDLTDSECPGLLPLPGRGRDWHGGDTSPADEGEVADRAALLTGDTAGRGGQGATG